jgi:isoleucyl-tRNA synthetase
MSKSSKSESAGRPRATRAAAPASASRPIAPRRPSRPATGDGLYGVAMPRQPFTPAPSPKQVDGPLLEAVVQRWWDEHDVLRRYLTRNAEAASVWSFIDGPMTANNPMGVHHAWGRTYKDLWQRFNTMRGYRQRYQNGWDCQGLHVEVEVEKELGFTNKHDIEAYGIARFV